MTTRGVAQFVAVLVIHPVPKREVAVVVPLHLKRLVQPGQNLPGIQEVGSGQSPGADDVDRRDRQQSGSDSVTAHVEQIDGKMIFIQPMITERVSPHLGRGQIGPLNAKGPIRRRRKNGSYITRGFIQLLLKPVLRLLQKILLPLQLHHSQPVQVPQLLLFHRRVDPGPKQGGIERFGQIIFRPQFDALHRAVDLFGS